MTRQWTGGSGEHTRAPVSAAHGRAWRSRRRREDSGRSCGAAWSGEHERGSSASASASLCGWRREEERGKERGDRERLGFGEWGGVSRGGGPGWAGPFGRLRPAGPLGPAGGAVVFFFLFFCFSFSYFSFSVLF